MSDSPYFTIVMTVYNRPQFLRQAVDSVLNQTFGDLELIVMEDNSPQAEVREILRSYNDDRMKVVYSNVSDEDRYKHNRYAFLINGAVRKVATPGKFICYLCDDDYYYPQRLHVVHDWLEEHPDVSVAFTAQHVVDESGRVSGMRKFEDVLDNGFDKLDHNSVVHRSEIFEEVDGWDTSPNTWGGGDSWFWNRISKAGYKFYPIYPNVPLEAKRYHTDAVQYLVATGQFEVKN